MNTKKFCTVTLMALALATPQYSQADQGIDIGSGWLFLGDLRTGYVNYNYNNPNGDAATNKGHKDSQGFYVVPKLSIQTPSLGGFYAKVTGAGATDFGLNNPEKESRNFVFDANDLESYAILQEAFLAYKAPDDKQSAIIGRNELYTPMIDTDDWYMLGNSFEVATYTNRFIPDWMFTGGYLHKMAGVWDSGANGTKFNSMSDASSVAAADKERADDNGVGYLAAQFDNGTHNAQIWGYHAPDLYNILFAQYDLTDKSSGGFAYDLGVQFIGFKENGELADHDTTNIDYGIYSARFDGSFENGLGFATGIAKYTDGEGQGATLGAWGGYPYFANGMIFHFFEAGSLQNASSYKLQAGYNIPLSETDKLNMAVRYTYFDLDPEYSISSSNQPQESMHLIGAQVSYDFAEGGYMSVKYEHHDTDGEPGTSAIRLIGGYRF